MAQSNNTLAAIFANEANTYTKVVAGYTVPVIAMFKEGDKLTALQARALSAYFLERGASVANSNIDRGSWKDKSDDEKIATATAYLTGQGDKPYNFSADIGGEVFGNSLLTQAAMMVLEQLNADKLASLSPEAKKASLEKGAVAFLNAPDIATKTVGDDPTTHEDRIRNAIAAIKATRVAKRERGEAKKNDAAVLTF